MLLLIWADEKYNTPKNPCVVFATQKNPGVFHRPPKNPFWPKCQTQKNYSDPPVIKICEWGPWGKIKQLTMEIERLSAKNQSFQAKVFSLDRFITSDKDLFYFTGFPNASVLESILRYLNPGKARWEHKLLAFIHRWYDKVTRMPLNKEGQGNWAQGRNFF